VAVISRGLDYLCGATLGPDVIACEKDGVLTVDKFSIPRKNRVHARYVLVSSVLFSFKGSGGTGCPGIKVKKLTLPFM
jgi:hypothetical protein